MFQLSPSIARIGRGEAPNSSGSTLPVLDNFFYLPGRSGGQTGYGATEPSGNLTLGSTAHNTKGKIFLGSATAYDEANSNLGIGTTTPLARIHTNSTTLGTAVVGSTGTVLARFGADNVSLMDIAGLLFSAVPINDICLISNNAGLHFIDTTLPGAAFRIAFSATTTFLQCGRVQSDTSIINKNMIIGGMGASYATELDVNFTYTGFQDASNDAKIGINDHPFAFSSSTAANQPDALLVKRRASATSGVPTAIIEGTVGTQIALAITANSAGVSPNKTTGAIQGGINHNGNIRLQNGSSLRGILHGNSGGTTECFAIQTSGDSLDVLAGGIQTAWSDSITDNRFLYFGDVSGGHRAMLIASTGFNRFTRLGIFTNYTILTNGHTGGAGLPAPEATPTLLRVFNSSADGANGQVVTKIESARTGQTGDLLELISAVASTVDTQFNARNVYAQGRIKTSVLFTDDNATISSAKLLGLSTANVTAGSTRTWAALDLSGNVPILGDDPPAVAAGSLGKVDLTAQSADITTTNLSNGPPSGDYLVTVYLQCTTSDATAGTLTTTIGWTDTVGATTDTSVTLALTATGRARGSILVKRASGEITYAVANSGAYNNARYAIDVRVMALG